MSSQLELYDIGALEVLQGAFSGFQSAVEQGLAAVQAEIAGAEAYVVEAIEIRRHRLRQAEQEAAECEAALAACENSGYFDEYGNYWPPDCRYEEGALQQAYRAVAECERRLEAATAWQERLAAAEASYTPEASALADLVGEPTAQARAELGSLALRYAAVHAAGISASAALPAPSSRGPASGGRTERGVQPVALAGLPEIAGISGPGDFSKISLEDMRAGLLRLQEMLPTIEGGAGASSAYWAEYDRQRGLSYAQGYQRVYDAFYGQGAIRVERSSRGYDVINGRHRIWLARQIGITQLPMRVVETG